MNQSYGLLNVVWTSGKVVYKSTCQIKIILYTAALEEYLDVLLA